MAGTLKNLLIGGGMVLASACFPNNKPDFENSKWINANYNAEIWSGYMGEKIPRSTENWGKYQLYVGLKNGQDDSGYTDFDNLRENRIALPDLDGDGLVTSGKNKYPE